MGEVRLINARDATALVRRNLIGNGFGLSLDDFSDY